jgi:hypothetical protein
MTPTPGIYLSDSKIFLSNRKGPKIFLIIMRFYAWVVSKGIVVLGQMKTKGATSHIDVPLSALVAVLQPTALVRVSRRWANAMGVDGERPAQPAPPKTVAIQAEGEIETKLEVNVDNW